MQHEQIQASICQLKTHIHLLTQQLQDDKTELGILVGLYSQLVAYQQLLETEFLATTSELHYELRSQYLAEINLLAEVLVHFHRNSLVDANPLCFQIEAEYLRSISQLHFELHIDFQDQLAQL